MTRAARSSVAWLKPSFIALTIAEVFDRFDVIRIDDAFVDGKLQDLASPVKGGFHQAFVNGNALTCELGFKRLGPGHGALHLLHHVAHALAAEILW